MKIKNRKISKQKVKNLKKNKRFNYHKNRIINII